MLCYVMLCYVMLCYVMLCYVMLCYVMLCYVMLCYIKTRLCFYLSSHFKIFSLKLTENDSLYQKEEERFYHTCTVALVFSHLIQRRTCPMTNRGCFFLLVRDSSFITLHPASFCLISLFTPDSFLLY